MRRKPGNPRTTKYAHQHIAGCVTIQRCHETHMPIGIYHGQQAELDPTQKWVTICEEHHVLVGTMTLESAYLAAAHPSIWCTECLKIVQTRKEQK